MSKNYLKSEFKIGAASKEQFPETELPEIAFAGRSNVGKSSLINSIVFRKNLARTSGTPGKTQEINFYLVNEEWYLVDMPGFGYAAKGKEFREKWKELNYDYLFDRDNLQFVNCLVDSRHDPMESDLALIETLENRGIKYLIVLTKTDKLKPKQIEERKAQLDHLVKECRFNIDVLPYSTVKKIGREELLGIINKEVKEWNTKQK